MSRLMGWNESHFPFCDTLRYFTIRRIGLIGIAFNMTSLIQTWGRAIQDSKHTQNRRHGYLQFNTTEWLTGFYYFEYPWIDTIMNSKSSEVRSHPRTRTFVGPLRRPRKSIKSAFKGFAELEGRNTRCLPLIGNTNNLW